MNQNLPGFVVMTDPRGGPIGSASNWTAGYMPAAYQGTLFRQRRLAVARSGDAGGHERPHAARSLDLLKSLNEEHLKPASRARRS
jgi:hypothetical protein